VRKAKKLRQEDLVDDVLSQAVISNIESGKTQVSEEKLRHLLGKLGLKPDDLNRFHHPESEIDEEAELEELNLKLIAIENIIDLVSPDEGLEELRGTGISHDHPLMATVHYLKGKIYVYKGNWKKAHKHFFDCIHLITHQFPEITANNLTAACYHELSFIEYSQNNLPQALKYSQEALKSFIPEGERKYFRELILITKTIYLQKLNRLEEAQTALDDYTQTKKEIFSGDDPLYQPGDSKEALLNMYEVQSSILRRSKMHSQAIKFALRGIELARLDRMYDRSFELWTTLGSIYSDQDKLKLAEICFTTALRLRKKIKREYLLAYVFTQLGMLYDKGKNLTRAEKSYMEAVRYSQKINDAFRETEALTALGECHLKQGETDKALLHLNRALDLAKKHDFINQKNRLLLILGTHLNKIGDPGFQRYALDFFHSHAHSLEGGEDAMVYRPTRRHSVGDPPHG
jgi:tetratricopeptide (TPR) repeat protein